MHEGVMNPRSAAIIGFVLVVLLAPITRADAAKDLSALRMPFTANRGQAADHVKFYAPTLGGTAFVTASGQLVYALPTGAAITEELVGGTVREVTGKGVSRTRVNVLRGSDPAKWLRDVPAYDAVSLGEVYGGVEVELRAAKNTVEKLFHVSPGGDPAQIRLKLMGARGVTVTERGELELETPRGPVRFTRPVAFQEASGRREPVDVAYVVEGDVYGFRVGAYDRGRTLVIDPLLTATFLGGQDQDVARALAVGAGTSVYVAGQTSSLDFPEVGIGSVDSSTVNFDAFVARLSADLSVVVAATFLGGSSYDEAWALALDAAGNVYVAGQTQSTDFPGVERGAAQNSHGGGIFDAFVAKLDATLSTVQATYLGGTGSEDVRALVINGAGHVYVAGETTSSDFPGIGAASADPAFSSNEGFVAKLDAGLGTLMAATYLGGVSVDKVHGLALDGAGNLYAAGMTASSNFPGVGERAGSPDFTIALT
jgi:hypothetical protein